MTSPVTRAHRVHYPGDPAADTSAFPVLSESSLNWGPPVTSYDVPDGAGLAESSGVYYDDDAYDGDTMTEFDETGLYCVEGGADGTFEIRITHPRTQEAVSLRVGASLSQAHNYIYSDVATRLGLKPIPIDRPRTITFASVSPHPRICRNTYPDKPERRRSANSFPLSYHRRQPLGRRRRNSTRTNAELDVFPTTSDKR